MRKHKTEQIFVCSLYYVLIDNFFVNRYNENTKGRLVIGTAGLSCEIRFLERGADVNRTCGSFFCLSSNQKYDVDYERCRRNQKR